jgi:hypothetical protein
MKEGDLVQFKFFKGSSTNLDNLGIVLELQTDLIIPSKHGGALYEKVDLMMVRWLKRESEDFVPYYNITEDGKRWYLQGQFYLLF